MIIILIIHSKNNGREIVIRASLLKNIMTDLLRGPQGGSMTDELEMRVISDLLTIPVNSKSNNYLYKLENIYDSIIKNVKSTEKTISEEIIDNSLDRIINAKNKFAILS